MRTETLHRAMMALVACAMLSLPAAWADSGGTGNLLDRKGGFRNVPLGITLGQLKTLDIGSEVVKLREKEDISFYKRYVTALHPDCEHDPEQRRVKEADFDSSRQGEQRP